MLEALGEGGLAVVMRARDDASGRIVALKQLSTGEGASPAQRRRTEALFAAEYHTLVRLKHPRIIEVYDYGRSGGRPYYTMELLDGGDLKRLAPLPYRTACSLLRDVASSLALLHAHRLVHRDVSPANVHRARDGSAKLIDFGTLSAFGPPAELAGTPACTAPEALRGMPLDQRTDLFALGVTAYFALTRRLPYAATSFEALAAAWAAPVRPPSHYAAEIPPALDDLIVWLLQLDPLARPPSAATVIERLTAIAELEPEPHEHAARSYLASGKMVGRGAEQAAAERCIERAMHGQGGQIVVRGAPGTGKTRLLHELGLRAQLLGMLVLKVDAQAVRGPLSTAAALTMSLLRANPELAERVVMPHARVLGHLCQELHERLGAPLLSPLPLDLGERRMVFQSALHEVFVAIARQRPLLLAFDNLHGADAGSIGFVSALGLQARELPLLLLAMQRDGDESERDPELRLLQRGAVQLELGPLDRAACEELVRSLFGDVANVGRTAALLHERSGGNPQHCLELVERLVRKGIATYAVGTWVLPFEVSNDELPRRSSELWQSKLGGLSPHARTLCEVLSVERRPVSIERCLMLSEAPSEHETHVALRELVAEAVLLEQDGSYRFAHESLREAARVAIAPERGQRLHARAAEALLSTPGVELGQHIEAAQHLLDAGQTQRGAAMISHLGQRFLEARSADESVEEVVRALEAAVRVYDEQGSDYHVAGVLFPMLTVAWLSDWRLILKHHDRATEIGLRITGLGLAQRLRERLGRPLSLLVGLSFAAAQFLRQRLGGLPYGFREAFGFFCSMVPAASGLFTICLDREAGARLSAKFQPLSLFPRKSLLGLLYAFAEIADKTLQGRQSQVLQMLPGAIDHCQQPMVARLIGEGNRRILHGGLLYSSAVMHVLRGHGRGPLELARQMDELEVRSYAMAACQVRLLYHAYRGELSQVRVHRERAELFAVQGGTTWQSEIAWPALLLHTYVLTEDALELRRAEQQLERLCQEVKTLAPFARMARAAHLTLRGDLQQAIALYEALLVEMPVQQNVAWLPVRAYFARALNLAGDHARAAHVAQAALAHLSSEDYEMLALSLEPQCQLALAEAGLGDVAGAAQRLDALLEKHGACDNPMLLGLLHRDRAAVAALATDVRRFDEHSARMQRYFEATEHPLLLALGERILARAARGGLRSGAAPSRQAPLDVGATVQAVLRRLDALLRDPDATTRIRCEQAVKWVATLADARCAHLYRYDAGALRWAASSSGAPPPPELGAILAAASQAPFLTGESRVEATASHSAASWEEEATLAGRARRAQAGERRSRAVARSGAPAAAWQEEATSAGRRGARRTAAVHEQPPADEPPQRGRYRTFLLHAKDGGGSDAHAIVGALALDTGSADPANVDAAVLHAVARIVTRG